MPEHDFEKLLGGFAADTLTSEEKQQLYSAALQDQELFNALADEQALKELLTDPVARRRLLRSLQATRSATAESSPSWRDRLRRPVGIAWAGGLTAAVFAVILGTKVYQESLQQAGQSLATDEARTVAPPAEVSSASRPATPLINDQKLSAKDHAESPAASPETEALAGHTSKQAPTVTPKPQARDATAVQQHERETLRRETDSSTNRLAQSKAEAPASDDQTIVVSPAPSSPASVPARVQAPASATTTGQAGPSLSARSLFYEGALTPDARLMTEGKERSGKSIIESTQRSTQIARQQQQFAAGKTKRPGTSSQSLGIRYNLEIEGMTDRNQASAARVTGQAKRMTLTIESNQDGYLEVWEQTEALPPHLLFPVDPNGQRPSKLAAHEHVNLSLQVTFDTLMIRFSRASSNSVESTMLDRSSQNQLRESVTSNGGHGSQEQATYVVNHDPSLQEIMILVPIHQSGEEERNRVRDHPDR
ncbi:MAG: hypothetical protein AAB308_14850 [Nitrospirota bacterium]